MPRKQTIGKIIIAKIKAGMTPKEIIKEIGRPCGSSISYYAKQLKRPFKAGRPRGSENPERDLKILRLRLRGMAYTDIAIVIGLSPQRVYQILNPIKHRARAFLKNCLNRGSKKRPINCSKCGALGSIDAHHLDYTKPLKVDWLCKPCHRKEHPRKKLK